MAAAFRSAVRPSTWESSATGTIYKCNWKNFSIKNSDILTEMMQTFRKAPNISDWGHRVQKRDQRFHAGGLPANLLEETVLEQCGCRRPEKERIIWEILKQPLSIGWTKQTTEYMDKYSPILALRSQTQRDKILKMLGEGSLEGRRTGARVTFTRQKTIFMRMPRKMNSKLTNLLWKIDGALAALASWRHQSAVEWFPQSFQATSTKDHAWILHSRIPLRQSQDGK